MFLLVGLLSVGLLSAFGFGFLSLIAPSFHAFGIFLWTCTWVEGDSSEADPQKALFFSKELALLWVVDVWAATRHLELTCGNSKRVRIGLLHSTACGLVPGFTNREEV